MKAGEKMVDALMAEVETWKRKFQMADRNNRDMATRKKSGGRLSFSVSREEAEIIKRVILGAPTRDSHDRGVSLWFAQKLERALARGDLLGKEG